MIGSGLHDRYGLTTASVFTNVSKVQCLLQREEVESGALQLGCNKTELHCETLQSEQKSTSDSRTNTSAPSGTEQCSSL